ncbi:hemolysin family protein [Qiania dongpingensis]|uniref:HlyC/CorC family transporter n=1 Tax=Qiania dongpingensis TaxID=2763669 RepID=A0A7G9G5E4_9FIRM|nr:hemolysin family protein [Qiania dongpingensis]QNM06026.1 HlyC/CorC family transporter [Qiania dongpingensis]
MIGPILLQIVLIFLNATFASAEIAVISMNETKLKKLADEGNKRAGKLAALTEQPARFLATIQVAITLAGLLGSAFAAENFAGPLVTVLMDMGVTVPENVLKSVSVFLITLVLAYFNLVFGELVPKRIAMKKSEETALGMAGTLSFVSKVFAPLVFLLTASTNGILRLMGIDPDEDDEKVTEEEIRMLLMAGNEQGTIDADENEIIQNVFKFDDITVGQICTHRVEVTSLLLADSMEEWERIIHESRHTHYPVCGESRDDILGVLDTKDYFRLPERTKEAVMEKAVDGAYFIPEAMKANVLFRNMKKTRTYFAVIIDEYGGMAGIITLHDLMEALVGDLYELEEPEQPEDIQNIGEGQWQIQGCADLDEVAETLGVRLPTDVYDTYNGFLFGVIGRVPGDGETFTCRYDRMKIEVHTVVNHRICDTTVTLLPSAEEAGEPGV